MSTTENVQVDPEARVHCLVDDFLWPWQQATAVFMHHGFCRNGLVWNRWVPRLAVDRRVYRIDERGCGESSKPPPGYVHDPMVVMNDAVAVMDYFGLDRVHWVGESGGGIIGLLLALHRPDRIASLVLCNVPYQVPGPLLARYALGDARPAEAIERLGVRAWALETIGYRLDLAKAAPELVRWYVDQMAKTPAHVASSIIEVERTIDLAPHLPSVEAPVLLISGDASQIATEQQTLMAARLPHCELRVIAGYGHGVNLLAPEECVTHALRFWEELS